MGGHLFMVKIGGGFWFFWAGKGVVSDLKLLKTLMANMNKWMVFWE